MGCCHFFLGPPTLLLSVWCFCCYCCYYGIILPFIVVEIIHDLSLASANTIDKRLPASIVQGDRKKISYHSFTMWMWMKVG
jgi:hypothetical protein